MNLISLLKKVMPVMVFFAVTFGVLNMGSYDPYNELTVLTPASVEATTGLSTPGLSTPTLSSPSLSNPELSTPDTFGSEVTQEVTSAENNSTQQRQRLVVSRLVMLPLMSLRFTPEAV